MAIDDSTVVDNVDEKLDLQLTSQKTNAVSNKITNVLSQSYADSEIRDALATLDTSGIRNTAETRRSLRLEVQKEVIRRNGDIVRDFEAVANVR